MAAREWVRWEEEILLEDDDEHHKECFYLCCAPPQGGGVSERDLAVVGKYWPLPAGNIVYSADVQFLRSLEEAIICGSASARAVTVAADITQLRWKSRKQIMDWLDSLISDPPYGALGLASPGDHDDGGSPASSQKAAAAAPAELAAPSPVLQTPGPGNGDHESAKSAPPRKRPRALLGDSSEENRLQARKNKGPDEPAKPVAEKLSLQQRGEEGDGISCGGSSTDAKRYRVDLTNFIRVSLKWVERKARSIMGFSDGSSQKGINNSASSGGAAPVNSVSLEETCIADEEAPVPVPSIDEQQVVDLTMRD
ncbi:hypothetical protein VPH35_057805 [Triticum aestivum]|uniref:Uncharacterized protein n=1 Tax=Aegilops tauschii TaxID=37682 RepID=R7W1F0_AEGTA